jgi:hypothetical protein
VISIFKSIWVTSPPGYQLAYLIGTNLIIILTVFTCYVAGLIPLWSTQVANFGFWIVYAVIFFFGQPRPWKTK